MISNSFPACFRPRRGGRQLRETVTPSPRKRSRPTPTPSTAATNFLARCGRELGALGLLGITVEEKWGGEGVNYLASFLGRRRDFTPPRPPSGLSYVAHSNLCVNQIRRNGNNDQKKRYLPNLVSGEHVGALAMSEPNAGSDVVSMRTRAGAERRANIFSTEPKCGSPTARVADVIVVYAKTEPTAGARGITAFIVEKNFPGFSTGQKLDKLGMRGSDTGELVFTDCEVPVENVLGVVGNGVIVLFPA